MNPSSRGGPKCVSSSSKRVYSICRAPDNAMIECAQYFMGKGIDRRQPLLNPPCNKKASEIRSSKTSKRSGINVIPSYLQYQPTSSANLYQVPVGYEKDLERERIFSNYKDRMLFTPPMIIGHNFSDKMLSSRCRRSSENPSRNGAHSKASAESTSDDFPKYASKRRRTRRKARYFRKSSKSCTLNNVINGQDKSASTLTEWHERSRDVNFNFFSSESMDRENNNFRNNNGTSKMKISTEKKSEFNQRKYSVEDISYPPEICPDFFYAWMDHLPIKSQNYCVNTAIVQPGSDAIKYENYCANDDFVYTKCCCGNPCCDCDNEYRCDGDIPLTIPVPVPVHKNRGYPNRTPRISRRVPDFGIKSREKIRDCPDFHSFHVPKFNPVDIPKSKREALIFCQKTEFAHIKGRDPIFYKLQTTENRPATAPRDYVWENSVKALRMAPKRPEKFFIDDRNGTRHNFIRSGLAPIYITGNQYGKVPEYLEERRKEQGLPPVDLSTYRIKKRCSICGHDHKYCDQRKLEEEKLLQLLRDAKKNRYHGAGIIPSYYNDVCCMNTTWGC